MQFNRLNRKHSNKKSIRVARGGKRGKTSGRGTKGQKARAGHKMYPEIRDMIKKLPKLRGRGKNSNTSVAIKPSVVNLDVIAAIASKHPEINPEILVQEKAVRRVGGRVPAVKVLADGDVAVKVTISGCTVSKAAREKIEKAGGSIA